MGDFIQEKTSSITSHGCKQGIFS